MLSLVLSEWDNCDSEKASPHETRRPFEEGLMTADILLGFPKNRHHVRRVRYNHVEFGTWFTWFCFSPGNSRRAPCCLKGPPRQICFLMPPRENAWPSHLKITMRFSGRALRWRVLFDESYSNACACYLRAAIASEVSTWLRSFFARAGPSVTTNSRKLVSSFFLPPVTVFLPSLAMSARAALFAAERML